MTTQAKQPERPRAAIRKIECARGCGFRRPYTDAQWWLSRKITHPLYGFITGEQLVQQDLWNHVCEIYLERRERARKATGYKGRVYSPGAQSTR